MPNDARIEELIMDVMSAPPGKHTTTLREALRTAIREAREERNANAQRFEYIRDYLVGGHSLHMDGTQLFSVAPGRLGRARTFEAAIDAKLAQLPTKKG